MLNQHRLGTFPLLLLVLTCTGATPGSGMDVCEIEKAVIHHMRPAGAKHPPFMHHVAIEDGFALATWIAGYAGGIAVLQETAGGWTILSESGGWDSYDGLVSEGVPKKTAGKLAKDFGMPEGQEQSSRETTPARHPEPSESSTANSKQYQACMGAAMTQRAMNACASDESKRADAELNRAYSEALSSIKNDPNASQKMVKAQGAWEAYRNAYIDAMYPAKDKQAIYGSILPLEVATLRANLARKQIQALSCLRLGPGGPLSGAPQCRF